MNPKEKQATPQVAFVFLGPLTKVPPAKAGSRARQCVSMSDALRIHHEGAVL